MSRRYFDGQRRAPSRFNQKRKFSFKGENIDIRKFINKADTNVELEKEYIPKIQFCDFQIDSRLKLNISKKGFSKPTPIQEQTIPHILSGKDIVGIANTGTGKTAAFLLPMINKVLLDRNQKVLILAPTRELALQIQEEFISFSNGFGLNCVLCIGGLYMGKQIRDLRRNYNFLIGTPGRLKDLIERRLITLNQFRNVILDEADRMLDMGFIHDIKLLLNQLPKEKHSLFFSATVSREIEDLIRSFLKNPLTISVKKKETAENVTQDVVHFSDNTKKIDVLYKLLSKEEFKKVLIFGRTKRGVDKLSIMLYKKGFRVDSIHGNKTQSKRQIALKRFKENQIQVLVATDVAARGLDIDNVSHVINYDLPDTYDDYIHRIGRTGRAEKSGIALTFVV